MGFVGVCVFDGGDVLLFVVGELVFVWWDGV